MLEAMRRGTQTWVAKILFGILVFSFAIWGVADMFTGVGRGSIAKIGDAEIQVEEFQRAYQNELDRFSRDASQRITAEQGRALGLDQRVLSQLVGGAAIEAHARELGLGLSDKTIVDGIQSDPDFADSDGKFSKTGFAQLLDQVNLSEQGFINLRRKDELRTHLIGAFVKGQTVPKPMIDLLHGYKEEKRVLEWLTLDSDKVVKVTGPDDAKLKELYEADKAKYMTPEFKKFQVLSLSVDDLKTQVAVSDEEIAQSYEATKSSYDTPEQRRIQQIAFKDKATAEAALKALRDKSKTFADVAKDAGAKDTDVDLGLVAKSALIDPKIADVAFSVEKDKFSDVIEGRFATVVLRVTQIEPGTTRTLADVKGEVRDKLATEKARVEISNKFDEVDDNRLAGKTLKEISEAMKISFKEIEAADRRGLKPDGKPSLDTPDLPKIMARVFATDGSAADEMIELANGGHAWVNVLSTDAPKQRPFEEVKEEIKGTYKTSEGERQLTELATKLTARINAGEPMSAIEKEAGGKTEKTSPITRTVEPQGLTKAAVTQAFTLGAGKAGHAFNANKTSQTIFRVSEIIKAAPPTKEQSDALVAELEQSLANQALTEYTESLKSRLNASINDAELKRALGATDQQ